MLLGAASAFKLCVKYWTILHRRWTLVLREKDFFTCVIIMIHKIDRDKQLNTVDSFEFTEAINLCQIFLNYTSENQFKLQYLITNLQHVKHTNKSL
jgi:hypothetical protein